MYKIFSYFLEVDVQKINNVCYK